MKYIIIIFIAIFGLYGCFRDQFVEKLPSKNIDINKYLGNWYEIARLPNSFEKDLVGVTATYSLKENGKIKVLNQGYKNTLSGEKQKAVGTAWMPNKKKTGRLKVSFFWPFAGDYIILEIDKEYKYVLVGSNKNYLWILSRTPKLDKVIYQDLKAKAKSLGYDIAELIKTPQ